MVEKERVFVTFTKPQIDGVERLVQEGVYIDRASTIRDAVRFLLEVRGISPFYAEAEG